LIVPRLKLSSRKHLPVFYINQASFGPLDAARVVLRTRGWKMLERDDGTVMVRHGSTALSLTPAKAAALVWEWPYWERDYLPPFSLKGKTVLDVGAGCGETAHLFFHHGANKLIAVEPAPGDVELLRLNAKNLGWNIEVIPERFSLEHLRLGFDFMKMDIEGGESALLELSELAFPCAMETHGADLTRQLVDKFGLAVTHKLRHREVWTVSNFGRYPSPQGR
jgi:SAM-dependent methyltransferase